MKTYKCGINPESNVHLVYRGGCEKPLTIEDAYRCTGCNQRFHKDCILEHFKQEKDHDWGRADERQKILAEVEMWSLDNEESESPDIDCDDPDCECQQQEPVDYDKVIIRNKLLAELRAKLEEMGGKL